MQDPGAYQIYMDQADVGKTIAASKKRFTWRFGFARPTPSRHELVLFYSVASGKRVVVLDGREIHSSSSEFLSLDFDFTHTLAGRHIVNVTSSEYMPQTLSINGVFFRDLPHAAPPEVKQYVKSGGNFAQRADSAASRPAPADGFGGFGKPTFDGGGGSDGGRSRQQQQQQQQGFGSSGGRKSTQDDFSKPQQRKQQQQQQSASQDFDEWGSMPTKVPVDSGSAAFGVFDDEAIAREMQSTFDAVDGRVHQPTPPKAASAGAPAAAVQKPKPQQQPAVDLFGGFDDVFTSAPAAGSAQQQTTQGLLDPFSAPLPPPQQRAQTNPLDFFNVPAQPQQQQQQQQKAVANNAFDPFALGGGGGFGGGGFGAQPQPQQQQQQQRAAPTNPLDLFGAPFQSGTQQQPMTGLQGGIGSQQRPMGGMGMQQPMMGGMGAMGGVAKPQQQSGGLNSLTDLSGLSLNAKPPPPQGPSQQQGGLGSMGGSSTNIYAAKYAPPKGKDAFDGLGAIGNLGGK